MHMLLLVYSRFSSAELLGLRQGRGFPRPASITQLRPAWLCTSFCDKGPGWYLEFGFSFCTFSIF